MFMIYSCPMGHGPRFLQIFIGSDHGRRRGRSAVTPTHGCDSPNGMSHACTVPLTHAQLSADSLSGEASTVAHMAPYVTDPTQFLLNMPTDKPFTTHVPASLFDECVAVLKRTVQWRVSSTRYNGALPHGRRYAWRKHYVCDHSGKPRDRRNPNLAPGKRRSRRASIKIGCPASFTATQEVGSDTVVMVCRFQHQGHTVNTREYWASSRIPDNVREWIKERVSEGHDQKEIVQMIHEHQRNAANIPPTSPAFIPPGVQITRMDVYNIIKRHKSLYGSEHDTPTKAGASSASATPSSAAAAAAAAAAIGAPPSAQAPGSAPPAPPPPGLGEASAPPHANVTRFPLTLEPSAADATQAMHVPTTAPDTRRSVDARALEHTAAAAAATPYPLLPTAAAAAQLSPATPEEAVSYAQQWSELVANLQALQPQMMEYALTAGTTRHPNTTAAWSHAITQLTQAWYVACHLLDRPVLPSPHPSAP